MEGVVIKREDSNAGDILLFFVNENGVSEQGVLTTVDSSSIQLQDNNSYIIQQHDTCDPSMINLQQTPESGEYTEPSNVWTYDETHKLLTFYNDNKQAFLMGATKRNQLWEMACKTILIHKDPVSCDTKLKNMKAEYIELCKNNNSEMDNNPLLDLCKIVFANDSGIKSEVITETDNLKLRKIQILNHQDVSYRSSNIKVDAKVITMLKLYLKYKKNFQQYFTAKIWETIALELGEDGKYWQKRFLNYKQHYIWLLEKRKLGVLNINWPYMNLFDEIFKDDEEFKKKYPIMSTASTSANTKTSDDEWLETEKIALLKYIYDCFEDFHNPNIPNSFLWTEVSRLLDKTPYICRKKYDELKSEHYQKYMQEYNLRNRTPLEILCDSIISKDIELEIARGDSEDDKMWKTEEIDEIVQFLYDNIEMFKDQVCYFVCWGVIAKKLNRSVISCRKQWEELVILYKCLLNDKKEHPDMQIDWRYIELFDRIFDYGMDSNLLKGYELRKKKEFDKIAAKKINISLEKNTTENGLEESYSETDTAKRFKRSSGDSKAFKILGYYQKHKDKLSSNSRNKHNLWTPLSKQIGLSETQCAHRLRNLKQVYTSYVQREIDRPEMPIVWPYYALCKKVFGYRALKNKLKNAKNDSDYDEWTASDIKQLINHFADNFNYVSNNIEDVSIWKSLASNIDKNEVSCREKFLELRKSYRKLKTQIRRNPKVKISWKYFNMFEQIYNTTDGLQETNMDIDEQEDEDFQCIIVMPEDADLADVNNEQITVPVNFDQPTESKQTIPNPNKWTRRSVKRLLINYIHYVRSHQGRQIIAKDMWRKIAEKLDNHQYLAERNL